MAASSRPSMTCATPSGPSSPATMPSGWLRRTAIAAPPRCVLPGRRRPSSAPHNAAYCPDSRVRYMEWTMFQMGGVGPMFGQYNHFANYAPEKLPYAIERYANEVARLHRVLD